MPARTRDTSSPTVPARGDPVVLERAALVREWATAEIAAGRPVGEDEAWERIVTEWKGIGTEFAERILGEAMQGLEPPPAKFV